MNRKPVQDSEIGEIISFYDIGGECHQKTPFELPTGWLHGTPVAYVFGASRPYNADPITEDKNDYVFILEESTAEADVKLYKLVTKTLDFTLATRLLLDADNYYRQRHFDMHPHLRGMYYNTDFE